MSTKSTTSTLPAPDAEAQWSPEKTDSGSKEEATPSTMSKEEVVVSTSSTTPGLTGWRKALILVMLCSSQFFDIFNGASAIAALPTIGRDLHFTQGMLQWALAAYTLTFGSMQVPAGRLSDIYHPKPVFIIGYLCVGIFSILCGVSVQPIMLLVFRAVSGIGAAMTVPSAIAMIVINIPEPREQAKALAFYGAAGGIGNIVGFIIGGVLSVEASWRWTFHLLGMATVPFAVVSWFLLPNTASSADSSVKRGMDIPGITILTGGLILFVYAISDGGEAGWATPQILTTLILSIVFFVAFFLVERVSKDPAIPPRTWFNKNFAVMFFYAWSPYWNFMSMELLFVEVFQDIFHWSPISAAVHCIPIGITGVVSNVAVGLWGHHVPMRVQLVLGQLGMVIGTILFALADRPEKYWSYIVPGMIINMIGIGPAYVGATTVAMAGAPPGEEGVVGAILYTSFQIGSTIGIAITSSIALSVNLKQPLDAASQFTGYAASWWSLTAMHGLCLIFALIFVRK
ncbi:hypothetical protein EIP91_012400 [Steccherinum ochraceum]|uniref:Major facilitator superfamily (MFS) profile domain-containing protein n=1 Tax=Steccherinum ochraceum TaxID=92696 RepID=A0A4R0RUK1_9APHY|nr:hypothetical protein EIP91_012400 [Steccherinum ochraceum]